MDHNGTGYPELSFHSPVPWQFDMLQPQLVFGYMYAEDAEKYHTSADTFLYIALNAHWEGHTFELPVVPDDYQWHVAMDSFTGKSCVPGKETLIEQPSYLLRPRSSAVLIAKKQKRKGN